MSIEIATLTMDQVREGLAAKRFSATELTRASIEYAESENPKTNAYLTFSPERALRAASK